MELQFKKISENEFDIVKEMLLQDKETSDDLWWAVELKPDTYLLRMFPIPQV